VLFDLGDTLLNFGRIETNRVFRESARLTYDYLIKSGQSAGQFWWYYLRSLLAIRIRLLFANMKGRDFDALSLLRVSGVKSGYKLSEEQWREVGWLWYEPLGKLARVERDIKNTLMRLEKMGLKLGILSNTFVSDGSLDRHLQQLGILDFFPYRLYSYQYEFRKPDRRIFQMAQAKIDEPAENILFVGDRLDIDVWPAINAGMQAVVKTAYTNIGRQPPKGVWRINKISELPGIIEQVNGQAGATSEKDHRSISEMYKPAMRGGI
jgi:HAD superfamily hydrolase (TIGR01549 family)